MRPPGGLVIGIRRGHVGCCDTFPGRHATVDVHASAEGKREAVHGDGQKLQGYPGLVSR